MQASIVSVAEGDVTPKSASAHPRPWAALCLLARLHHIAADPDTLMHERGMTANTATHDDELLGAAKQLGLKAKISRTSADRLSLAPLPALAKVIDTHGTAHWVLLAQCDGQRVLFQDPSAESGGRPTIEPIDTFLQQWAPQGHGQLLLATSRASLAGDLAKFDFTWFIPSLVKYRKLLGEVLAVSLFLQLFALISPLFFQVVMDKVLVHKGLTTLDVLVMGLVVVVLFERKSRAVPGFFHARQRPIKTAITPPP